MVREMDDAPTGPEATAGTEAKAEAEADGVTMPACDAGRVAVAVAATDAEADPAGAGMDPDAADADADADVDADVDPLLDEAGRDEEAEDDKDWMDCGAASRHRSMWLWLVTNFAKRAAGMATMVLCVAE